jgi:hypothetical protein
MEKTLDLYEQSYNPKRPLLCFDERPCFLIGNVLQPIEMKEGQSKREHYEYEKNGSCVLFLAVEPATGFRYLEVHERRTKQEYTRFMQNLYKVYPNAEKIVLVQDNLNTHNPSSFYETLTPEDAFFLSERFEMHYTPKKASWLNMAEIELSAFGKQCLNKRIPDISTLRQETLALANDRNIRSVKIHWQFTKNHAREKFHRFYPNN